MDKLAKVDQLELLRLEGKKIIVTDKVVAELDKGFRKNVQSAIDAYEWLKKNRNEPWLELEAPTPSPELKKGHGERSIVDLINERKPLDSSINYTILTDNKKDLNKISGLLNEPQNIPIRMVREFTNELAQKKVLSVTEYNAIEQKMMICPRFNGQFKQRF